MKRPLAIFLLAALAGCGSGGGPPPPPPPVVTIPDLSVYLVGDGAFSDGQDQVEYSFSDPRGFWVTAWTYPTHPADNGGEVYVSDGTTVSICCTQDGSQPGIQRFAEWGLFNKYTIPCSQGWTQVDSLGRACEATVTYPGGLVADSIISEHYSQPTQGGDMERFYFARGRKTWEAYNFAAPRDGMPLVGPTGGPPVDAGVRPLSDRRVLTIPVAGTPGTDWPPTGFVP
jgi:hypothetical protein